LGEESFESNEKRVCGMTDWRSGREEERDGRS